MAYMLHKKFSWMVNSCILYRILVFVLLAMLATRDGRCLQCTFNDIVTVAVIAVYYVPAYYEKKKEWKLFVNEIS